jgi:hypothetical protein
MKKLSQLLQTSPKDSSRHPGSYKTASYFTNAEYTSLLPLPFFQKSFTLFMMPLTKVQRKHSIDSD